MDKLVFLDTETTGNALLSDRICQVCYSKSNIIHCQYFKPPVPISVKAQSITHITNKMVAASEEFISSKMKKDLKKLFSDNILVAHNAPFDIAMLAREGVSVPKFICTLKIARFLDTENKIPEYNLQYLRYFLELEVKASAHDAKSDVIVLKALFNNLYSQMLKIYKTEEKVIETMMEISSSPFLIKFFNFGKYKDRKVEEIVYLDKAYLHWLLTQKMQNSSNEDDWIYTLKYHLKIK